MDDCGVEFNYWYSTWNQSNYKITYDGGETWQELVKEVEKMKIKDFLEMLESVNCKRIFINDNFYDDLCLKCLHIKGMTPILNSKYKNGLDYNGVEIYPNSNSL